MTLSAPHQIAIDLPGSLSARPIPLHYIRPLIHFNTNNSFLSVTRYSSTIHEIFLLKNALKSYMKPHLIEAARTCASYLVILIFLHKNI